MPRTKYTFEEVKAEFDARGYDLISTEYHNKTQKLEYICRKHPDSIRTIDFRHFHDRGQGCKQCVLDRRSPRSLPDSILIEYCERNNLTFVRSDHEKGKTIVFFTCPNHPERGIQKIDAMNLKNKKRKGCNYCLKLNKKTHEEFLQELQLINSDIEILGTYTRSLDPIRCKCKICGHEWTTTPNILLSGKGCFMCTHARTHDDVVTELRDLFPSVVPLGKYNGINTPMKFYCLNCHRIFEEKPSALFYGKNLIACKYCRAENIKSTGEIGVAKILDSWGYDYQEQYRFNDCRNIFPLPFDFYLIDDNTAIEYDGIYHYEVVGDHYDVFEGIQERDEIKNQYCKNHDINLIRVPYWEYDNLEHYLFNKFVDNGLIIEEFDTNN